MNKFAIILCMLIGSLLITPTIVKAEQLPECNTAECTEYFKAYRILAKRGHSSAMAMLGELYYAGYGTEKNLEKALKWTKRAGRYGVLDGKYKAGVMYLQETELKDVEEGIELLSYASRRNHVPSSLILGKLYLDSQLVPQDLALADKYLSLAYQPTNKVATDYINALYSHEDTKSLPLNNLYGLVKKNMAQQSQEQSVEISGAVTFPEGEMETITVTRETFEGIFQDHIEVLKDEIPDTSAGTGSKIAGQTCEKIWACSSEGDGERIRDFMMSLWGLNTLGFR